MPLKHHLLEVGYFPEDLPPSFSSFLIAQFFSDNTPNRFLTRSSSPVRSTPYNASKRGLTRRVFSVIHPVTAYDSAEFTSSRWDSISDFLNKSKFSMSIPKHNEDSQRALEIMSHGDAEQMRLSQLSHYRFIAKTDISRFYHSIYTHSLPWAFHGKPSAKADRNPQSAKVFFNRADQILRCGQDGQTIGIPVGPDVSRVFAETISTAIDLSFQKRYRNTDIAVLRHVDDVWIGANTHADTEEALWRYREAIREFELDINENKTQIYEADFSFSDHWPTEIARQIEYAITSHKSRIAERLRSALETSFGYANDGDDGVLKYTIRFLDRNKPEWDQWHAIEPFLKRCAVHFGHTIDYVVRVLVWRHLAWNDLDIESWTKILNAILNRHGRLGNDSEVCWGVYACTCLKIEIHENVARNIVENCGPLSVLAIANCVELKLTKRKVLAQVKDRIRLESDSGPFWPVLLEWKARKWRDHSNIELSNEVVANMADKDVTIFDSDQLPSVFRDINEEDFASVTEAIESGTGDYDDDYDEDDNGDVDIDPLADIL